MRFGPVPLADAEGAILAHSVAVGSGRLRKGRVLTESDLATLRAHHVAEVIVARLDPSDLGEDVAALRLAEALVPDPRHALLRIGPAATGRVNLFAEAPGIIELDVARIHSLNGVDPAITVATVPPWQRLGRGGLVATVKIIPYGVDSGALDRACDAGHAALRLRPAVARRATLVQTRVDASETGDKGHHVTEERLSRLGVALDAPVVVAHEVDALTVALERAEGDAVLILTGSATSDLADTAPEAVRRAGGRIAHFGMPVDPGNLLFYGTLDARPVIGLPGCARSPALNGADWVIERLLCGVAVTPGDIAAMGVGGLLKEIPQRGRPREA